MKYAIGAQHFLWHNKNKSVEKITYSLFFTTNIWKCHWYGAQQCKNIYTINEELYNKACLCELSHKGSNTDATHLVSCYNHSPPASMQTSCTPEEPAKTDLPLLPGGATILCHFWNSVVFRQSRGLSAYALWRDISSCIGSKITHSCKIKNKWISYFNIQPPYA